MADLTPVQPPELVLSFQGCDVLEADLARKVLYLCGFRQRRKGDNLLVFNPKTERDLSPEGRVTGFYAQEADCPDGEVGELYIDEGFYSDTLRSDGTRGYNNPWAELVDMTDLMHILQVYFHPEVTITPSPYIGHGRSKNHYAAQYMQALIEGDQSKHPRVRFTR